MSQITLPKEKKLLSTAVQRLVDAGLQELRPHRIRFQIAHLYMQGARDFRGINFETGQVQVAYRNSRGELNYKFEMLAAKFRNEIGRKSRIDLGPAVEKGNDFSLDNLRRSSMAQAVLNAMMEDIDLEGIKAQALQIQAMFGMGGLALWGQTGTYRADTDQEEPQPVPGGKLRPVVEVIPPWQLLPIPSNPILEGDLRGVIRHRRVPLAWLKERDGLTPPAKGGWGALKVSPLSVSDNPNTLNEGGPADAGTSRSDANVGAQGASSDDRNLNPDNVWLSEVYLEDYDGSLLRYIAHAGGHTLRDDNYAEKPEVEQPRMPIAIFHDMPTVGFWTKSFVDLLLPTNIEVEALMKNLFENMQDLDNFGALMVPLNQGIDFENFKKRDKPRIIPFEPDITMPEAKTYNIAPNNLHDFPGKVAAFGVDLLEKFAGQSGGILSGDAPGRVDSASGLGFLFEAGNIPLAPAMTSLARAFSKIYKALLGMARSHWPSETLARLTMLDDTLVGIVIDPQTGRVKLDANSVPNPSDVRIKVRSQLPTSPTQRKQELTQAFQLGTISLTEFRIINQKEGLGLPMLADAEWHNYRKAILNNIILFGDGSTPGKIITSSEGDNPEVQLEFLQDFMARPEFVLASREVRMAFEERKAIYEDMLGRKYPKELGAIDQEAEVAQMRAELEGRGNAQNAGGPQQ